MICKICGEDRDITEVIVQPGDGAMCTQCTPRSNSPFTVLKQPGWKSNSISRKFMADVQSTGGYGTPQAQEIAHKRLNAN